MPYCKGCGCECKAMVVDDGIGSYEFWGARGIDSRPRWASECCEEDVFEDENFSTPYTESEPDYPEPDYDDDIDIEMLRQIAADKEEERQSNIGEGD